MLDLKGEEQQVDVLEKPDCCSTGHSASFIYRALHQFAVV